MEASTDELLTGAESVVERLPSVLNQVIIIVIVFTAIFILLVVAFSRATKIAAKNGTTLDPHTLRRLKRTCLNLDVIIGVLCLVSVFTGIDMLSAIIIFLIVMLALIVAVGCKSEFEDLGGGFTILSSHPFSVGDTIEWSKEKIVGEVEKIHLATTTLRTTGGRHVIIPNRLISSTSVINLSLSFQQRGMIYPLDVNVTYESNMETAIRLISEAVVKCPSFIDVRTHEDEENGKPPVNPLVVELGDNGILVRTWVYAKTLEMSYAQRTEMYPAIKRTFDANGVSMSYPHLVVEGVGENGAINIAGAKDADA